jgi:cytochrome c oxidase assembly protein subunit 15
MVVTPLGWLAARYSVTSRSVRIAAAAAVTTSLLIILTGAIVRVTGSGLGCPEWPSCTGSTFAATPETGAHGAIEFGNRLLTGALCLVVGWLIIVARLRSPLSRPVLRGAWAQFWIIVLNAVVGGITVWLRLSPYIVAAHFLAAVLLLTAATVTWHRARSEVVQMPEVPARCRILGGVVLAVVAVLLVVGTLVTGTGPHAGDSSEVPRMPFDWTAVTVLHGVLAATTVALVVLLTVLLAQGGIGGFQVLTDLNGTAVVLHVLGSAFVWVGAVRVFLDTRRTPAPVPVGPAEMARSAA